MIRTVFLSVVVLLASTVAPLWAADFDHSAHIEEYVDDAGCGACHIDGAISIVPATSTCVECHDAEMIEEVTFPETLTHGPAWSLNHGSQAKGVSANCSSCHEQNYCLDCHKAGFSHEQGSFSNSMLNVHRSDFTVSHPLLHERINNVATAVMKPASAVTATTPGSSRTMTSAARHTDGPLTWDWKIRI